MPYSSDEEYDASDRNTDSSSSSEESEHFVKLRGQKRSLMRRVEAGQRRGSRKNNLSGKKSVGVRKSRSFKSDAMRLSSKLPRDYMEKVEEEPSAGAENRGFEGDAAPAPGQHLALKRSLPFTVSIQVPGPFSPPSEKGKKVSGEGPSKRKRRESIVPMLFFSKASGEDGPDRKNSKEVTNKDKLGGSRETDGATLAPDRISPKVTPKLSPRLVAAHMKRKFSEAILLKPDNLVSFGIEFVPKCPSPRGARNRRERRGRRLSLPFSHHSSFSLYARSGYDLLLGTFYWLGPLRRLLHRPQSC